MIAPNMGKPIVVFQAMIDSAAKAFPNALKGYKLDVVESHQTGKADTSGTAKAVVESMGGLGLNGSTEKIQMIREPEQQVAEMGVPKEHLGHHAFHTYVFEREAREFQSHHSNTTSITLSLTSSRIVYAQILRMLRNT